MSTTTLDPAATSENPNSGKPTCGQPEYDELGPVTEDIFGDPCDPEPESVGWDLAWGCKVSFGAFDLDGPLRVTVGMSDYEAKAGICVREVTPAQVRLYAEHLLRLAGDYERRAANRPAATEEVRP